MAQGCHMACEDSCVHAAGVSAFQAPGKRQKVAAAQEAGAKGGTPLGPQLPETPRPAGLPHLKVPTPGSMGGAKATMESSTAAPIPVSTSSVPAYLSLFLCSVSGALTIEDVFVDLVWARSVIRATVSRDYQRLC